MNLENCIKYLLSDVIDITCFFFIFQLSEDFQIFNMAHKTVSWIFFSSTHDVSDEEKEAVNINLRSHHLYLSVEVT